MPVTSQTARNAREYEEVADHEYELGGLVALKGKFTGETSKLPVILAPFAKLPQRDRYPQCFVTC